MRLEINKLGWRQELITGNQWEGDNEDEFDSEDDIELTNWKKLLNKHDWQAD